ncbi:hypothetical protein [Aliikangiella maris]|uniref:DUF726 domain-containing protein n=1 Tax=Aliikangiella maris TaxID=3162458 RepID=A0ABV2C003_9GAMM
MDDNLLGSKNPSRFERTALYKVSRMDKSKRINSNMSYEEIQTLNKSWDITNVLPLSSLNTPFAAINGMQNDLTKAAWLMGVHLDWAYQNYQFDSYCLVHNPTEDFLHDLWECGWDKNFTSLNANHLSAIMVQAAKRGKSIKWVAHSQGGIILLSALKVISERTNTRLTNQQVALHSIGTKAMETQRWANKVGLKIIGHNANPFDIVPNLAGGNDFSIKSLDRSIRFLPSVIWSNNAVSPHTLPFMGIQTYYRHLTEAGKHRRASWVRQYMIKNNISLV